jgi:small subunit ribosomal protein S29
MMKEFQDTRRCAVMVRESFLDLRDNFRRIVDPAITAKRKGALILLHLGWFSSP